MCTRVCVVVVHFLSNQVHLCERNLPYLFVSLVFLWFMEYPDEGLAEVIDQLTILIRKS